MRDGGGKVKAQAKPHEPEDQHQGESMDSPGMSESFQAAHSWAGGVCTNPLKEGSVCTGPHRDWV